MDSRVPGPARIVCFALGALALLGLLGLPAAAQGRGAGQAGTVATGGGGAPLLLVPETEIDLGDLPKGSTADARFELRNGGDADLRILDVRTGCSCTVATYDEVIPPGKTGSLVVTLDTETINGVVGQGVSLMTNDPTSPATYLLVRASVVTAVRILPEEPIRLRDGDGDKPVLRVVRRSGESGHGFFNIVGLKASEPWLAVSARKVREPAPASAGLPPVTPGDWILEVGLNGQPPYGKRRASVEFKTGLDRQPDVKLDVQTSFRVPVAFPVERLFLQGQETDASETLVLTVRDGLDPRALRVESSPAGLTVQLDPGEGQRLTARVRWTGGALEDGRLVFHIQGEETELPVLFQPPR